MLLTSNASPGRGSAAGPPGMQVTWSSGYLPDGRRWGRSRWAPVGRRPVHSLGIFTRALAWNGQAGAVLPLLEEVADRQFGVFTTAQALAAGYSREEIRTELRVRRWGRPSSRCLRRSPDRGERAR